MVIVIKFDDGSLPVTRLVFKLNLLFFVIHKVFLGVDVKSPLLALYKLTASVIFNLPKAFRVKDIQ